MFSSTPVVSPAGIVSTRFVTSGHMSLPPRPYLFSLSLHVHDRLVALSSTEFRFVMITFLTYNVGQDKRESVDRSM